MKCAPSVDLSTSPVADRRLTRMVPRAHQLLAEILTPGDLAVDLTAGNGGDTLFLWQCVGSAGRVVAFDIQSGALERTGGRLAAAGAAPTLLSRNASADLTSPGIYLIHDSHAELARYLGQPPRGVIANLGYLPGGDPAVKTDPVSTLAALRAVFDRLAPGGRVAVVLYVAHPGGAEEGRRVEALFTALPSATWRVLSVKAANCPEAPFLLAAEKH